jgi:parallel beta helix pectate lyase-like protein
MYKKSPCLPVLLTAALPFLADAAQATISHTWVSSTGNDANACTRSAPCATFAGALTKTSAGGEIDVADAGDYGPVTIGQAVSIEAAGVLATIQVTSGNAITISAGANDTVVLRGLTLDGQGTAGDGIRFSTGGALYVEDSRIHRFTTGIDFLPNNTTSKLFVTDTIVRNNGSGATGGGVFIQASGGQGFATASIDGLRTENNVFGVKVMDAANVTIRNSVAANNGFSGFSAVQSSNTPKMLIESSITAHNGTNGIISADLAVGAVVSPEVRLSNVTVVDNQTGLATSGFGRIISFGNNKVDNNSTNGSPTSTIPPM